jgi:hypothetical protein
MLSTRYFSRLVPGMGMTVTPSCLPLARSHASASWPVGTENTSCNDEPPLDAAYGKQELKRVER